MVFQISNLNYVPYLYLYSMCQESITKKVDNGQNRAATNSDLEANRTSTPNTKKRGNIYFYYLKPDAWKSSVSYRFN